MLLEKRITPFWVLAIWLILVCGLAFWWGLGDVGLVDETEPLFAEAARQMTVSGDWVTPYFDGETRFDKPPLIYWLMAIGYQTIGINEWAVRIPSAAAATLLTFLVFYTLRQFGLPAQASSEEASFQATEKTLWRSAAIGATLTALNLPTIVIARSGVADMLLGCCMDAALLTFFWGYAQPEKPQVQSRCYLLFYIFSALAVLTKGPVGVVLPAIVIGLFLVYMGNVKAVLREMRLWRGGAVFLALSLPWFVLVIQANGEAYLNSFFGYHNIERFISVVNDHSAPWYFYFLVILLGFAPWSVYLPAALARLRFWQRRDWQNQPRTKQLGIFAIVWMAVIFVFFTIAETKRFHYILPLLPAAAIVIALLWSEQVDRSQPIRSLRISNLIALLVLVILSSGVLYSFHWLGDDPSMPHLPQALQKSGVLLWGGGIWAVTAIVGTWLLRRRGQWLWGALIIGFVAFTGLTLIPTTFLVDVERQLPLRQIAETIAPMQPTREEVIMLGFKKPSLVFYAQRPVTYMTHPDRTIGYLRKLDRQITSALILGYPDEIEETNLRRRQYQIVQQAGVYQLIRVSLPLPK